MRDKFGREIDYLRISVTDRCNLRCRYCMPSGGVEQVSHSDILSYDEILRLARIFASLGFRHIKITGGEPTVRRGLPDLIKGLKEIQGISDVTMTSNGILLGEMADELKAAGLDRVNVSLDTLDSAKYKEITLTGELEAVLNSIDKCENEGLRVRVNAVNLDAYNRDESVALAGLAKDRAVDVRFIEMMPVGLGGSFKTYGEEQILAELRAAYGEPSKSETTGNGPAKYYDFPNFKGSIGFISALSHKFCTECNKVRLTSEGVLKPCLQGDNGIDLRELLRDGLSDSVIREIITKYIYNKPAGHEFEKTESLGASEKSSKGDLMFKIGG